MVLANLYLLHTPLQEPVFRFSLLVAFTFLYFFKNIFGPYSVIFNTHNNYSIDIDPCSLGHTNQLHKTMCTDGISHTMLTTRCFKCDPFYRNETLLCKTSNGNMAEHTRGGRFFFILRFLQNHNCLCLLNIL